MQEERILSFSQPSLLSHGYAIVKSSAIEQETIENAWRCADEFFKGEDVIKKKSKGHSKYGWKRVGNCKERIQFRLGGETNPWGDEDGNPSGKKRAFVDRVSRDDFEDELEKVIKIAPTNFTEGGLGGEAAELQRALTEVSVMFRNLAKQAFVDILSDHVLPDGEEEEKSHLRQDIIHQFLSEPEDSVSASVLNVYRYFNSQPSSTEKPPESEYSKNCRQHIDPGLITILGRGDSPGLQLFLPYSSGGRGEGEERGEWVAAEEIVKEDEWLILVGESLEMVHNRMVKEKESSSPFTSSLHRVVEGKRERTNIIFELRPRVNKSVGMYTSSGEFSKN